MRNRRVVAVAYDGLCAFEFGVASELFGLSRPEFGDDWYDFSVVGVDAGPLHLTGGATMHVDAGVDAIGAAGTVVLPGWRDVDERPPDPLLDAIRDAHRAGTRLFSICSGVFVLAAAGVLNGQRATTHWRYTDQLRRRYPEIRVEPDVLYVDNGTTLTSAGSAAGIDCGLHLIRRDHGVAVANQVARRLVVPPHRDGGQAQFITAAVPATGGVSFGPFIDSLLTRLDENLTVATLAAENHMAPRTFARRFRAELGISPHRWLVQQRVARARELLETSDDPIEEVARRCGLGTAATLRHHFGRELHTTPTRYRQAFRARR